MSKKIDINKVLSTGSAKQRAILLFYHFNLQEAIDKGVEIKGHTLPLTSKEASILFESFKENKDVKVYNEYRILNKEIIQAMRWLLTLVRSFEIHYWKYKAFYLSSKYEPIGQKVENDILELSEGQIIDHYSTALEYYTALKIYIKESGYKDKYVIGAINSLYEYLKGVDWTYKTKNGDIETVQNLVDVEPDEETIKDI